MSTNTAFEKLLLEQNISVKHNEPLARYSTFKIGGPARYFFEPTTPYEVVSIVNAIRQCDIKKYILGAGSNILIRDDGVEGAVISLRKLKHISIKDTSIEIGAGYLLTKLINKTISLGLGGLEHLGGIPASMGGAVFMNAGGKYGDISTAIDYVDIIDERCEHRRLKKSDITFAYRKTTFGNSPSAIVIAVGLALKAARKDDLAEKYNTILNEKKSTQPLGSPNAGCIFKNPPGDSAGRLIDTAGLKGISVGSAYISRKHGNFIINPGGATASDVLKLIDKAREGVRKKHGIELELEVKVW